MRHITIQIDNDNRMIVYPIDPATGIVRVEFERWHSLNQEYFVVQTTEYKAIYP